MILRIILLLLFTFTLQAQHGRGRFFLTTIKGNIISIDEIESVRVPAGTAFNNINFSDYGYNSVTGLASDGSFVDCTISWSSTGYSTSAGTYVLNGTLSAPDGYNTTGITPQITVNVVTLETEYQSILTYATGQGWTLPSAINQGDQNAYVAALKANSTWTTKDVLYVTLTDGDRNFARINWKNPGTNNLTENGTLTFTSRQGFTGNGTTGYLNTGYNTASGTQFTQNEGGFAAYSYNNTVSGMLCGNVATGARLTLLPSNRAMQFEINGNTNTSATDSYSAGYYHVYRASSSTVNLAKNGGAIYSAVADVSVARPNTNMYLLARSNAGTADAFSVCTISLFWAGASHSAKVVTEFNAFQTYLLRARVKPTIGSVAAMGTVLNDSFARASVGSDYTTIGSATFTCDGTKLVESGGALTTYTNRLLWKYGHSSENCVITRSITLGSAPGANTGTGIGFADFNGVNGERSIIAKLDLSTGGDAGKVSIFTWNAASAVQVAVASTAIPTIANGNSFTLTLTKTANGTNLTYTVTATRTSDSAQTTATYQPSSLIGDSTGDFALFAFGGTINTTALTITLNDTKNNRILFLGNSLTHGYAATTVANRWASQATDETYQVSAGSGDLTADVLGISTTGAGVLGKMRNLIDYNSRYYALAIGGNDVGAGAAYEANLRCIANTLKNEGYKIIFITPPPRNDADLSVITTFTSTFTDEPTISAGWTACKGAGTGLNAAYNSGDNVHMNNAGHAAFGAAIAANLPILY
jgi:lysophospholipase L1-like esterase